MINNDTISITRDLGKEKSESLSSRKKRDLVNCSNCSIQLPLASFKSHINICSSLYTKPIMTATTTSSLLNGNKDNEEFNSNSSNNPNKQNGNSAATPPLTRRSSLSPPPVTAKKTNLTPTKQSPVKLSKSPTSIKTRTMTGNIPQPLFLQEDSDFNTDYKISTPKKEKKTGKMSAAKELKTKKVVVRKSKIGSPLSKSPTKNTTPTKSPTKSTTPTKSPLKSPSKTITPTKSPKKEINGAASSVSPKKRKHSNTTNASKSKDWSKNTTIDWKIPEAPVFYPSIEEFKSPLKYIESIRPIAEKFGICKIVPPFEADSIMSNIDPKKFNFKTKIQNIHQLKRRWNGPNELFVSDLGEFLDKQSNPIQSIPKYDGRDLDFYSLFLEVNRYGGCNECTHTNKWPDVIKALKVTDFCNKPIQTLKNLYHRYLDDFEVYTRNKFMEKRNIKSKVQIDDNEFINDIIEEYNQYSKFYSDIEKDGLLKDEDDDSEEEEEDDEEAAEEDEEEIEEIKEEEEEFKEEKNKKLRVSREEINNDDNESDTSSESSEIPEFGFYEGNVYSLEEFEVLANNFSKKWFPLNNNDPNTVENEFWRIVEKGDENVQVHYGSDLDVTTHGSGFSRTSTTNGPDEHWNLNQLPKMKESLFSHMTETIAGVTDPMMYIGMLFSSFCWHNEDNYLYSINYLHKGTYKTWYGVPGSGSEIFEKVMKASVPELFERQPNLLYLLITMISPDLLKRRHVPIYKCLQGPGEYVITFPQAYHAGFSHGFTIAEAVNFAPADWIPFGSSSIERYQKTHRSSVFSHEQLLYSIANRQPSPELSHWLSKEFQKIKSIEQSSRNQLIKQNPPLKVETANPKSLEELLNNEPLQCYICKYDCFLSYVSCCEHSVEFEEEIEYQWVSQRNIGNLQHLQGQHQKVLKVCCLSHFEDLCDCSPSKKKIVSIFSIDDLENTIQSLNRNINNDNISNKNNTITSVSTSTPTPTCTSTTPQTRNMTSHKPVYKFPSPSSNDLAPTPSFNLIFSNNKKLKIK
ncbi:hypothetical protein DICPUDRAFT_39970 [Dictyostelium purpureum]|uniref:ARID domain-containing protein n=1 Tax=Dictyostelium purpureum TaxID=5786 RepID=F0ZXD4_DICPU|nr:uncharacterized protein DICPUDRAFT_39970 [Dictyostelium purpureum]EGC31405.1 hypothetical protein DICPUDRAFT_39970 [Dictyostelium purpureum]|eukprot:XP_003292075.1 hypothetical protein DICPUDRAFT_39970 [Dictyostelium purpureum]